MAFDRVFGQEHAVRALRAILRRGRLAHAYLFLGPQGVGKATLARELAKAVLCRRPRPDACDACESCRRFDADAHPDFHWFAPPEGKRYIVIDDIRELQHTIGLKPVEGGYKAFLIDDAHLMTAEAANAFLKTLEEPPANSLLALIAPTTEGMLDTILSRCQRIRFHALPADLIARVLQERYRVGAERAAALARFAGGSLGRAVAMTDEETQEFVDWLAGLAEGLTPANALDAAQEVLGRTRRAGERAEAARARLRDALQFLLAYYRDLLLLRAQNAPDLVFNVDRLPALESQCRAWRTRQLERAVERVMEAMTHLDMNVNLSLLLEGMFLDLARAKGAASLY